MHRWFGRFLICSSLPLPAAGCLSEGSQAMETPGTADVWANHINKQFSLRTCVVLLLAKKNRVSLIVAEKNGDGTECLFFILRSVLFQATWLFLTIVKWELNYESVDWQTWKHGISAIKSNSFLKLLLINLYFLFAIYLLRTVSNVCLYGHA